MKDEKFNTRRQAMGRIGAFGMTGLFGFGSPSAASGASSAVGKAENAATPATPMPASAAGSCILIPSETAGPYPLLALLGNSAMVRKDIREGKAGIPLTLVLQVQDVNRACRPITNAAVYIWHCDKDGGYSGYSNPDNGSHAGETYLRGIQLSDANGEVSFTTIFPGWYQGRITHIHFQIYLNDNLDARATATSQLAFPQKITRAVYDTPLYRNRGQNTTVADFSEDGIFSDGAAYQIAAVSGDPAQSLRAALTVGISG